MFDNATTHLKCAEDAISARNMLKRPSSNFRVTRMVVDEAGNIVHGSDKKPLKKRGNIADEKMHDGTPQLFHFPEGHEEQGQFKRMVKILEEQSYENAQ